MDLEFKQLVQKHDPKHAIAGPLPAEPGAPMARSRQTARKTTAHADGATDHSDDDGVDDTGEEQPGPRGKRAKLDPGMSASPAGIESLPGATPASRDTGDCDADDVCTRPLLVHLDQQFERVGLDCQQRGREIAKELSRLTTDGTQVAVVTPGPVHEATRMCCLTVTAMSTASDSLWLPNGKLAFDIAGGIGHELKAHTGHEWELHNWSLDLDDVPEDVIRTFLEVMDRVQADAEDPDSTEAKRRQVRVLALGTAGIAAMWQHTQIRSIMMSCGWQWSLCQLPGLDPVKQDGATVSHVCGRLAHTTTRC